MAIRYYNKDTASDKIIPINDRVADPLLTIQNGTSSTITVTVSLDGTNYATPLEGAISSLAANSLAKLSNRYKSMKVVGTGTGTIYVAESG